MLTHSIAFENMYIYDCVYVSYTNILTIRKQKNETKKIKINF